MSENATSLRPPLITGDKTLADVTRDICAPMDGKPTGLWWAAFIVSVLALILGVVTVWYQIATGHRHLGTEQDRRLGVRHHELCLLGRHRTCRHADLGRAVSVPTEMANGRQSVGRSDDTLRRHVCRDLSADSHGTSVAGLLDDALSQHAWIAVGQLQIAAAVGRVCDLDLSSDLRRVLVRRSDPRPGHHSRSIKTRTATANHVHSVARLGRIGENMASLRNGLHAAGRIGDTAGVFGAHDRQHGLCHRRHSGMAHDDLSAVLCGGCNLQRPGHGDDADDHRPHRRCDWRTTSR